MGSVTAMLVGGPWCGNLVKDLDPDAVPAEIVCRISGGHYALTPRQTVRAPGCPPEAVAGRPVYEYVPEHPRAPRAVSGGCKCGCRRTGADA